MSEGAMSLDPTSDAYFKSMRKAASARVSKKRFAHMEGVAATAELLARTYGHDATLARLAGILHDWDKDLDNDVIRQKAKDLGVEEEIGPWVLENMPQVVHGPTAAAELARTHPEIPDEVISAIRKHTIADPNMSPLDEIIYVADAIEPGRRFEEAPELRALIGEASLDELYAKVYQFWTARLVSAGALLHPDTLMIWNELAYPKAHERLMRYEKRCKEKKR